ncbi:hypothetical protein [Chondromyces apiculatus]|uniref:Lipoprotein n=1 Tax=Chondromyces apiculatus DSM 436 TaxID=1192034 RepID=A0A017T0M6_9BACT|nr:hypothetical protein [Chondromyces apiculatus]EYF02076.1 Hypothetical protein CAP_7555 [Chondromyces apiculatus DSM 436]
MSQLTRRMLGRSLLLVALASSACDRATLSPGSSEAGPDASRNWTLQVSARNEVVAELVFEENKLARVAYTTKEQALRDSFQARLDAVMAEAQREGLYIKFHLPDENGERGALAGATPKPGAPHFAQAMYEHLSDNTFSVRVK